MSVHVLSQSLAHVLLTRLRNYSTDRREFTEALHQLSLMLTIKATEHVTTFKKQVETPLETISGTFFCDKTALVPIMRAGSGMLPAFQLFIPESLVWHVSMSRDETTLQPKFKSSNIPTSMDEQDESGSPLIDTAFVLDPMLATGGSAHLAIQMLEKSTFVNKIIFVGILGAPEGVERLENEHPNVDIILAGLDRELNEHGYILPGLGNAGDRLFPTR